MKNLILTGSYGSGKTQLAINLALDWQKKYKNDNIALIDLDIVNPYFRSREMAKELEVEGVEMVLPPKEFILYEAPALSATIAARIKDKDCRVILDVGGNSTGARVLGRYYQDFINTDTKMWMVINTFRPGTSTGNEIIKLIKDIEESSRFSVKGLINNTNLGKETTPDVIIEGYRIIKQVSEKTHLPLVMTSVNRKHFVEVRKLLPDGVVFPIDIYLQNIWHIEE